MAQKPSLYIHIGHPKAGSTTLQAFLYENAAYLDSQGFTMPTAQLECCSADTPPGNPINKLQALREANDMTPLHDWLEQASKTHNKLLLSSECLSDWFWHKPFLGLSNTYDIHLIYYMRRQDEFLLSAWRQWGLKRGLSLDAFIDDRIENDAPNYLVTTMPWRNRVGVASTHCRFVGKDFLQGGSITSDLAAYLELDISKMQSVSNQNTSIDARALTFMSERPEMFRSIHDDSIFKLLRCAETENPLRLSLSEAQFARIEAAYETGNQSFLEAFDPANAGTPVIERSSARVDDTASISASDQKHYIQNCLKAIPACDDPRIEILRKELL